MAGLHLDHLEADDASVEPPMVGVPSSIRHASVLRVGPPAPDGHQPTRPVEVSAEAVLVLLHRLPHRAVVGPAVQRHSVGVRF